MRGRRVNDNRPTREQVLVNNPYVIIPILLLLLLFRVYKIFALEICCFIYDIHPQSHPHPRRRQGHWEHVCPQNKGAS